MLCGYLLAAYMGVGFYFVSGANQWRGAMGIQMGFPAILLAGIYWMPESPRYLLSKNRIKEAWQITRDLHSNKDDTEKKFAKREFYQMRKTIEHDSTLPASYLEIFRRPSLRKRAMMTIMLEVCIQSSGILVVLSKCHILTNEDLYSLLSDYGSIIYKTLGFSTTTILNLQGGFQVVGAVFGLIALTFVDKVPRPRLIGLALMSCAACLIVITGLEATYVGTNNNGGLIACVVFVYLFQAFFAVALDGAAYYYVTEIWPTHLRSHGLGIAVASLCCTDIIYLQCAPLAFAQVGWKYYLVFIIVPTLGGAYIWWSFPDTLHKPLEEIAALFGDTDMVVLYQQDIDSNYVLTDIIEQEIPAIEKHAGDALEVEEAGKA